ncbi:MAG: MBL fold metallo-hydrolase [Candidatus Thermoplasmatota archaeon]|jgi:glyoxylase-like metal-dependent hydrolase (beta-lactamase superfamily II)|nr:MBL fold metallo-hydrolase [Candidatus Thermoplasmatota archaeon]MCL5793283.1 MBL fold metallo-hydrolase [Candidatus Thermoplasmatota archaeon]
MEETIDLGGLRLHVLHEGNFSLDPGAAFGIVPIPVWSRVAKLNPNQRISMSAMVAVIEKNGYFVMIDSGVGIGYDEKFASLFEVEQVPGFHRKLMDVTGGKGIDMVIHTHLHFDHSGGAFSNDPAFSRSLVISQDDEVYNMENPDDLSRVSYRMPWGFSGLVRQIHGNSRLKGFIEIIRTGGHTSGHEAIIIKGSSGEIICPGDLFPTSFNLRPTFITAIDHYPLDTLRFKKAFIRRAIRNRSYMLFNHDSTYTVARVKGEENRPVMDQPA